MLEKSVELVHAFDAVAFLAWPNAENLCRYDRDGLYPKTFILAIPVADSAVIWHDFYLWLVRILLADDEVSRMS